MSAILLDTNLLVLYVVGAASRQYVAKHRRLAAFTVADYDLLIELISKASAVLVTPNTLTETSNLASQIREPARSNVMRKLREVAQVAQEHYVASRDAASQREFLSTWSCRCGSSDGID